MSTTATARHGAGVRYADDDLTPAARPGVRRSSGARLRTAHRAGLMRGFVVFIVCLTVLAVGRVALSFAVVQKSLQTDAIVRQERSLTSENGQLAEDVAQLASTVRVRHIAESQLGLVDPTHVVYLKLAKDRRVAKVAERD